MLEILLMDEEIQEKIYELLMYAEANPFDNETMEKASKENTPIIPQGNYNYVIELPMGIRVVYTIEEHPIGICRHISISCDNSLPETHHVMLILENFNYDTPLKKGQYHYYHEECHVNGEECKALNVIQKLY